LQCKLDDVNDRAGIANLLRSLNVRVWLNFKKVKWGNRLVNKLESGVVCVGSAPDPVQLKEVGASDGSYSMVNRGDRRKFEPRIAPFASVFAYALPPYLERAARFVS